jgi:hypothetical protein
MRGTQIIETLIQDLRFGLRQLRRNPGFSAAAIAIAALGVAATCVIFSFAEAAVLRALPYKNPSSLVSVTMTDLKFARGWPGVPVPVFLSWRAHAQSIGSFAASDSVMGQTLAGVAEPTQVFDYSVSQPAFRMLGVPPALGRGFLPSDYRSGSPPDVLLSYQQLFQGRRDAVRRTITLDGVAHAVVGVMPPDFLMPGASAWESVCWTPLVFNAKQETDAKNRSLSVWARLRPGVSPEHAQAALSGPERNGPNRLIMAGNSSTLLENGSAFCAIDFSSIRPHQVTRPCGPAFGGPAPWDCCSAFHRATNEKPLASATRAASMRRRRRIGEIHFGYLLGVRRRLEVVAILAKAHDTRDEVVGEKADIGVVILDRLVVPPPLHRDTVFRPLQLVLQFQKIFVGLELGIVLNHR